MDGAILLWLISEGRTFLAPLPAPPCSVLQPDGPLNTSTLRRTPSGSMRLPVRRPAFRGSEVRARGSISTSTGASTPMISETSARGNLAPSPPPSPWLCQAPKISAVGDSSSNAVASAGFAAARRRPCSLCMNGTPSRKLSRRIASYTRCGASSEVIRSSGCRSAALKSTLTYGRGIASPSVAALSSASSSRFAWLWTLSIRTHHTSLSSFRRRSNTWRGGSPRCSPG